MVDSAIFISVYAGDLMFCHGVKKDRTENLTLLNETQ